MTSARFPLRRAGGGKGITNDEGMVGAGILLSDGEAPPIKISAKAVCPHGARLFIVDPIEVDGQPLVLAKPCVKRKCVRFKECIPLRCPRTIGFWKHQVKVALCRRGRTQVSACTLKCWLPLRAFGVRVSSLRDLYKVLWLTGSGCNWKPSMEDRARQQFVALLLNLKYRQLALCIWVDVDEDGKSDMAVGQAIGLAKEAFESGDPETAKTILDNINNLGKDCEEDRTSPPAREWSCH